MLLRNGSMYLHEVNFQENNLFSKSCLVFIIFKLLSEIFNEWNLFSYNK